MVHAASWKLEPHQQRPHRWTFWRYQRTITCDSNVRIDTYRAGINTPFIYAGDRGTVFPWHIEDCGLYSMNYHINGAAKVWYVIPSDFLRYFEEYIREFTHSEANQSYWTSLKVSRNSQRQMLATALSLSATRMRLFLRAPITLALMVPVGSRINSCNKKVTWWSHGLVLITAESIRVTT